MHRFLFALLAFILLAATCVPQFVSAAEGVSAPRVDSAPASEIRFALLESPRYVNVWELFERSGATYANYALRSEYYPRLYRLVPPKFSLQPLAAQYPPTKVVQEGDFYTATIRVRTELKWTDGSAFTAADVAFTANTALTFELGHDWSVYYSREYLDHAQAVDLATVKFFFKKKPNVGAWQYGALQGPIVQKTFWEVRLAAPAKLLPDASLKAQIEKARVDLATVQSAINEISAQLSALKSAGRGSHPLEIALEQREREMGYAQNTLNKLLDQYADKVNSAHGALYTLSNKDEPTLGTWIFDAQIGGEWINKTNPGFPFGKPNFDRVSYRVFSSESAAVAAFKNKEVDFILTPNGLSSIKDANLYSTYSARFIVFNPLKPQFADPVFHAALSCMIDRDELAISSLAHQAAPLDAFVLSAQWHNSSVKDRCAGMSRADRIERAVKLLKDAGYSWAAQPTRKSAGRSLLLKGGAAFPKIVLSAPSKAADPLRYSAAKYVAEQAQYLGISFSVSEMSVNDVVYAVFSSQQYDAALVGWRLSEYPGYICEWFGGQNHYLYSGYKFASRCTALAGETNLDVAQKSVNQIESDLMTDLPFIPLFITVQMETYQNLAYPLPAGLNGWSGVFGAPSYAMPSR